MTIYNINFGIGWASSGVEYAQKYRAEILRNFDETARYVFLNFIQGENIQHYTANMQFKDEEIIWIYQYFTDIKIRRCSYPVSQLIAQLQNISRDETQGNIRTIHFNDDSIVKMKLVDGAYVYMAEYFKGNEVYKRDFYTYTLLYSEYLNKVNDKVVPHLREFYNEDGTIAYQIFIHDDREIYKLPHHMLYSKAQFIAHFIQSLNLTAKDIMIVDRAKDMGQAIIQYAEPAKIGVVIHAEHFNKKYTDEDTILWNHHYEYQFVNNKKIDFFITSTDIQNNLLAEQLKQYHHANPKVYTIPVGSIKQLTYNDDRNPFSIITASRLAKEKHLDWIVKAVIKAKAAIPELTLQIYGEGPMRQPLTAIINEQQATEYIQLKGHVDLSEVYQQYELFVSASTSEGFGLTLLEAVGSGLAMIGFDVNYGNPTFIQDGKNGYLIPYQSTLSEQEIVTRLSRAIIKFYELNNFNQFSEQSYKLAQEFLHEKVTASWQQLLTEVRR